MTTSHQMHYFPKRYGVANEVGATTWIVLIWLTWNCDVVRKRSLKLGYYYMTSNCVVTIKDIGCRILKKTEQVDLFNIIPEKLVVGVKCIEYNELFVKQYNILICFIKNNWKVNNSYIISFQLY